MDEVDLSVHWLDFFREAQGIAAQLECLQHLIRARHVADELTLDAKRSRFVTLQVNAVHAIDRLMPGGRLTLRCEHAPRFEGDSHSGIFPTPEVRDWPAEDEGAFLFAVQTSLAACADLQVHQLTPT